MKINNYKFRTYLLTVAMAVVSLTACELLEKPEGSDKDETTVFKTEKDFEAFLYGTYAFGMHSIYPYYSDNSKMNPNPSSCMTTAMTDESEQSATWHSSHQWNSASIQKNNITGQEDARWTLRWDAIRRCNLIIKNIGLTPYSETQRQQFVGEVHFIRALNNFEMFKRYGGMPIVDKAFDMSDDWARPRASVENFVKFIVEDCDLAAQKLEGVQYTTSQRGRVTASAALALKAKVLLYAASPMFNSAEPFMPYDHPELVCYGNYDSHRWELAADAAKKALEMAAKEGFSIIDTDHPEKDYQTMWEEYDNKEIILAEKYSKVRGNWSTPWSILLPAGLGMNGWENNGYCVTHNFISKYDKRADGQPQTWNEPGVKGHDLMEKYAELDYRFSQTVAHQGAKWNDQYTDMNLHVGASGVSPSPTSNKTGALMHKLIPYALSALGSNYQMVPNGILFRVGELYLNLAEALNESMDTPSQEVYDALHVIRDRAGMPDFPAGLNKEQMRERIKKERDIELAFEDHRMWDIRRWLDAEKEGVMKGKFYKVVIEKISGAGMSQVCDYTIEEFETRQFNKNMYLHPILENEVNKGYLFQNPGW